jgi:excisionase family DNA binding protein
MREGGDLRPTVPLPRLALSPDECARALGVSRDFFDEHVMPELRIVRRGRRRLVPVRELERWLSAEAALPLRDDR